MKTIQLNNGVQSKPYADHIYSWEVTAENGETEDMVLEWCRKNLKDASRSSEEYFDDMHKANTFDQKMDVVCGGKYSLRKIGDNKYNYTVVYEYID